MLSQVAILKDQSWETIPLYLEGFTLPNASLPAHKMVLKRGNGILVSKGEDYVFKLTILQEGEGIQEESFL